jgi:D-alanine-D-alanine ligase
MNKQTVLLLFGGESSEHEVSIASARNVHKALDNTLYNVQLGFIDATGKWWLRQNIDNPSDKQLLPMLGDGCFRVVSSDEIVRPDVILPILHGKNGEDGAVQALAQLLHIPIDGCDMTSSAICKDKIATKEVMVANNIKVVPYVVYREGEVHPDFHELSQSLSETMFVKPARSGSSVGVSKVRTANELDQALEEALSHDSSVLIEKAMNIRELEVAVLGNPPDHTASVVGEVVAGADFYSYEAKYNTSSSSHVEIPANISQEKSAEIRALAENIYSLLGCKGLARIDFFLSENAQVYLNEVNTLPGFTDISMYPKMWEYSGLSYANLINTLLRSALASTNDNK